MPHAVEWTEVRDRDETDVFRWLCGPTTRPITSISQRFSRDRDMALTPCIPTKYPHACLLDDEDLLLE